MTIVLLLALLFPGPSQAGEETVASSPLGIFARTVVERNRRLIANRHNLEAAHQQQGQSLSEFRPSVNLSEFVGKSANRNYNVLSGLDEDYTTRRRGYGMGIKQRTPLGNARFDLEKSRTEYTSAQTSYFVSAYLSLEKSMLRRDDRLLDLERKLSRSGYSLEQARYQSQILDILIEAYRVLFQSRIAHQNLAVREQNLDFYRTLVAEAEVKLENGLGSELDLKQARMRLTLAETESRQSRIELEETRRRLEVLLGAENNDSDAIPASFSTTDLLGLFPADPASLTLDPDAAALRPDVRLMELEFGFQRDRVRLAREKARPDLKAGVRWGRQGRATSEEMAEELRDKSWDVTIAWETSLGHRPERMAFRQQRELLLALQQRLAETRALADNAIVNALDRLRYQRQRLTDLQASERLSAEVLEGQKLNFQLGKVSLLDLTRYQADAADASLGVIRAEAELVVAWLNLWYETASLIRLVGLSEKPPEAVSTGPLAASPTVVLVPLSEKENDPPVGH